ncbi:MAG: XTP/dITP diphosphatase [Candidatus ainarchaeum sp.]|nr:XTP/dITP diphosphatase [Candidatus ainarchaeum sp.]
MSIKILFATGNAHKFAEASAMLRPHGIGLQRLDSKRGEIRAEDVEQVALASAKSLFAEVKKPLIVEDSGLFIPSLNDFPGAYSAWVQKKLGNKGILKLMKNAADRSAYFKACVAYADKKGARTFCGEVHGSICESERGSAGFGYDPIFVPAGETQTFAENETLKNRISHRFNAFTAFARWYSNYVP